MYVHSYIADDVTRIDIVLAPHGLRTKPLTQKRKTPKIHKGLTNADKARAFSTNLSSF